MKADRSHDPNRSTWIDQTAQGQSDFPIQNLPLGVFREAGTDDEGTVGVRILDRVLDLQGIVELDLLDSLAVEVQEAACRPRLNGLLSLSKSDRTALRISVSDLLSTDTDVDKQEVVASRLRPIQEIEMVMPVEVGDYTDFYASIDHAQRVGALFRPENPLLPNYRWVPVGYHGRASSVVVGGTPIKRPSGQRLVGNTPSFDPSFQLDYEMEVGVWIGQGNKMGESIPMGQVEEYFAGVSLLNDWSARDIQSWEAQPLGPFLGKSFATSVSPWLVTAEALIPFRCPSRKRVAGEPKPLPHLSSDQNGKLGGIDAVVEVWIQSVQMREESMSHYKLSSARLADLYWTIGQMIAHHSSNGCPMRPGDLLGTGTVSGKEISSAGCLLELTARGENSIQLPSGETRSFLEDGDEIVLRGYLDGAGGYKRIGLGECRGTVAP